MVANTLRVSLLLLSLGLAAQAQADSITSTASSAGSASVGSVSDSVGASSKSSTGGAKVADGDYRVIDVAALTDRPGMVRVRMQANAEATSRAAGAAAAPGDAGPWWLDLPQQAWGGSGLAAGDLVRVRNRVYGLEFAAAPTPSATPTAPKADGIFFLALNEAWRNDLDARAVKL